MVERQSRRFTWPRAAVAAVVAGDLAGGWFLHVHNHLDIRSALVIVCMLVATVITVATAVICRYITSNHAATRAAATEAAELARVPVTVGQRVCSSTKYIPHRDLEPARLATLRDLTADHTGDISDYR
jgi:hypothetical protein